MDLIAEVTARLAAHGIDRPIIADLEKALREEYGGERVYIPMRGESACRQILDRDREIVRQYRSGHHVTLIARRSGLSRARVYQILHEWGAR